MHCSRAVAFSHRCGSYGPSTDASFETRVLYFVIPDGIRSDRVLAIAAWDSDFPAFDASVDRGGGSWDGMRISWRRASHHEARKCSPVLGSGAERRFFIASRVFTHRGNSSFGLKILCMKSWPDERSGMDGGGASLLAFPQHWSGATHRDCSLKE